MVRRVAGRRLPDALTYEGEGVGKTTSDSYVVDARFIELTPDERVVQEVDFESDDPSFAGTMIMTWALETVVGGTLVTFRADDVPAGISAEDHIAGFTASLENLAAYVA